MSGPHSVRRAVAGRCRERRAFGDDRGRSGIGDEPGGDWVRQRWEVRELICGMDDKCVMRCGARWRRRAIPY